MTEIIDDETYSWMKIVITKNWDYTYYEFVNLSYWGITEGDDESARSFIEDRFDDEYMGSRGYSWTWNLIDKPPLHVVRKKIRNIDARIANLEESKKRYEKYLEE